MKTLIIFFTGLFSFLGSVSGYDSELIISNPSGERFFLEINGRLQNDYPQQEVIIYGLGQNKVNVRISFANRMMGEIYAPQLKLFPNHSTRYEIVRYRRDYSLEFTGKSHLKGGPAYSQGKGPKNGKVYGKGNGHGNGHGKSRHYPRQLPGYSPPAPSYPDNYCYEPMDRYQVEVIRERIERRVFRDEKLREANRLLEGQCISSRQVRSLMEAFAFEQSSLEFAKSAYDQVMDPENYGIVFDGLAFSSSKRDLERHIEKVDRRYHSQTYPAPQPRRPSSGNTRSRH